MCLTGVGLENMNIIIIQVYNVHRVHLFFFQVQKYFSFRVKLLYSIKISIKHKNYTVYTIRDHICVTNVFPKKSFFTPNKYLFGKSDFDE